MKSPANMRSDSFVSLLRVFIVIVSLPCSHESAPGGSVILTHPSVVLQWTASPHPDPSQIRHAIRWAEMHPPHRQKNSNHRKLSIQPTMLPTSLSIYSQSGNDGIKQTTSLYQNDYLSAILLSPVFHQGSKVSTSVGAFSADDVSFRDSNQFHMSGNSVTSIVSKKMFSVNTVSSYNPNMISKHGDEMPISSFVSSQIDLTSSVPLHIKVAQTKSVSPTLQETIQKQSSIHVTMPIQGDLDRHTPVQTLLLRQSSVVALGDDRLESAVHEVMSSSFLWDNDITTHLPSTSRSEEMKITPSFVKSIESSSQDLRNQTNISKSIMKKMSAAMSSTEHAFDERMNSHSLDYIGNYTNIVIKPSDTLSRPVTPSLSNSFDQNNMNSHKTISSDLGLSSISKTVNLMHIQDQIMPSYSDPGHTIVIDGSPIKSRTNTVITSTSKTYAPMSEPPTKQSVTIDDNGEKYIYHHEIHDKSKPFEKTTIYKKTAWQTTKATGKHEKHSSAEKTGKEVVTILTNMDRTNVAKPVAPPGGFPLYLTVVLNMAWAQFCELKDEFKTIVVQSLKKEVGTEVKPHQVLFMKSLPCEKKVKYRRAAVIEIHFYIADSEGQYNYDLTEKCAQNMDAIFTGSTFENKVSGVYIQSGRGPGDVTSSQQGAMPLQTGVLLAIVLSGIAGLVFCALLALQIFILKRRRILKKLLYNKSCKYEDGHNSDSIHLTSVKRFKEGVAYANPGMQMEAEKDMLSHLINFAGLDKYANDVDFLAEEFRSIPNVQPSVSDIPQGSEEKNRYANVIPVPQTRLCLSEMQYDPSTTYINANFIKGYGNVDKAYIATQAPLNNTIADFWRMVWEHNSQVIVMLTLMEEKGLSKCAEYWPNQERKCRKIQHGNFQLTFRESEIKDDCIISTLTLKDLVSSTQREITHCWYRHWPAHRVPSPSLLLKFVLDVHPYIEENQGPTVVHCSPGTGRTGAFLAIEISLRQYNHKRTVNVLRTVTRLRTERAGCVQTRDQYILIYKVLNEYSTMMCNRKTSSSSSDDSLNDITEKEGFIPT